MFSRFVDRYWRWRAAPEEPVPKPWEAPIRAAGFYPAYADWVGGVGVDAEGRMWFTEHGEEWSARRPVEEPELRFAARADELRQGRREVHDVPTILVR